MKKTANPISPELIAPCGRNCAIFSRYLSYRNKLPKSQCVGCRPGNRRCTYLFKNCSGPATISNGKASYCFHCEAFPCRQIERMDKRYRLHYHMSVKSNLEYIRKNGIDKFINEQYEKYRCRHCGGVISIHNRKCFKCDKVTKLVEKHDRVE